MSYMKKPKIYHVYQYGDRGRMVHISGPHTANVAYKKLGRLETKAEKDDSLDAFTVRPEMTKIPIG